MLKNRLDFFSFVDGGPSPAGTWLVTESKYGNGVCVVLLFWERSCVQYKRRVAPYDRPVPHQCRYWPYNPPICSGTPWFGFYTTIELYWSDEQSLLVMMMMMSNPSIWWLWRPSNMLGFYVVDFLIPVWDELLAAPPVRVRAVRESFIVVTE